MYAQTGKTFIATLIAVALSMGGLAWLSSGNGREESKALAQCNLTTQQPPPVQQSSSNYDQSAATATSTQSSYEEGYRAGYRDGHEDCAVAHNGSGAATGRAYTSSGRSYSTARTHTTTRVAGTRYYASERPKGHSTRNMIL